MTQCPACGGEVASGSRFCGACGAPATAGNEAPTKTSSPSALPTEMAPPDMVSPISSPISPSRASVTSSSVDQGRFIPGTILAKRYRIIGLLGRGGMGEVYRADDLKLGQPVALKFLPRGLEKDENRLQRFLNEVKMALKVSHPNVCRVHDIGEMEGQHYISMEYVDGEDLASLLRRIGRLPKDKAVQAARQLCAGLAAAHDQGVLHRDLKPANVMIDGRGQVKITDFGLAGLDDSIEGAEARAGTPAYMAPEQWAGKEVTTRSDLYSLGLVLYELFTGDQPYKGKTPAEILQMQEQSAPTTPSSLVEGFDPAVERLIFKCLEKEPSRRPASALSISAALPGGDPLAAALAAGETPSPELVAQAGESEGLNPAVAATILAVVVVGLFVAAYLFDRAHLPHRAVMPNPPEYLAVRAQEILREIGFDQEPGDSLYWFEKNNAYINHVDELPPAPHRWRAYELSQPAPIWFHYRQSPERLARTHAASIGAWGEDPAPVLPGMAEVALDAEGRLLQLHIVPPASGSLSSAGGEPVWDKLFQSAGFDPATLSSADPEMRPPVFADQRRAWTGHYPDHPQTVVRLEAASLGGVIVSFRVLEPWTRLATLDTPGSEEAAPVLIWMMNVWAVVIILAGILLAVRNLRLGRGDRRTALRMAFYMAAVRMLWLPMAHHPGGTSEIDVVLQHLGRAVYYGFLVFVWYLALEPYARKLWPGMLVSWVRLWRGQLKDPLVGRDLLIGACGGVLIAAFGALQILVTETLGIEGPNPGVTVADNAFDLHRGFAEAFGGVAMIHLNNIFGLFMTLVMLLLLRLLLRRTWAAVLGLLVLIWFITFPGSGGVWSHVGIFVVFSTIYLGTLFRFGLLAFFAALITGDLLQFSSCLTLELSAWYAGAGLLVAAIVLAIAGWGFYTSLAGRPLFRDELAGDSPAM